MNIFVDKDVSPIAKAVNNQAAGKLFANLKSQFASFTGAPNESTKTQTGLGLADSEN